MTYVIVSECERGFWSNQYGWVHDKASASIFTSAGDFPLPLRARHEGSFLDTSLAPEFYLEDTLLSGDEVVWADPSSAPHAPTMRVHTVKTADGCARTSEDIVVLRDTTGTTMEALARALAYASPAAIAFQA